MAGKLLHDPVAALRRLRAGGVVALPTEAVFGLHCLPGDADAVARLRTLKRRPSRQGLILVADSLASVAPWLQTGALPRARIEARRLRPVTWLLPAGPACPEWVHGSLPEVAVRITHMPLLRAFCTASGGALVSTSANRRGWPPARTARQVQEQFGDRLDGILDAPVGGAARVSELRRLDGTVLR
ncbi:MAG: tRNA threonylcarbamoyladenosine biosynthesis protein RimN [Gammaproteobacteria bacterium]|nr:MAG: tRNA threonylcarbamoyladenosine biosynthesis protein RimN [Gammaproteobacteria bacterium]